VRDGGLAPEMRVRILEFLTRTKKGTAVTSNVSATSGSSSASIWIIILAMLEQVYLSECCGGEF
jgi:hypothetical protein